MLASIQRGSILVFADQLDANLERLALDKGIRAEAHMAYGLVGNEVLHFSDFEGY